MTRNAILLIMVFLLSVLPAADPPDELLTTAESSGFTRTSSHAEVMELVFRLSESSPRVKVMKVTESTRGREIPLVVVSRDGVVSPEAMRMDGRSAVLINANIHAGEVEGKAAALMLIRDLALAPSTTLLENQVLLIIPDFNPDGNDSFGRNRGDNGPELAGTRANGQNLDLNRDFLKMESPEVRGLVDVLRRWDPVLFMDLHTTNGSYHREPVTYTTLSNPNTDPILRDYMWKIMFPAVQKTLKQAYGFDSIPYGNFMDRSKPEKGWANHAFGALYSTNYVGLRNRFTILDENYSHADFRTRVLACHAFLRSVISYTAAHLPRMSAMTREADRRAAGDMPGTEFVLDYEVTPLLNFTIKSYRFSITPIPPAERDKYPSWYGNMLVKPTSEHRDYPLTYYAATKATKTRQLPEAYLIEPGLAPTKNLLLLHGVAVERLVKPVEMEVESFDIEKLEVRTGLFQGHPPIRLEGKYSRKTMEIPVGSWLISMNQPLARLIPELLEPDAAHGLLQWGHFSRMIQLQWSRRPGRYPVMRIMKIPAGLRLISTQTVPQDLP